MKKKAIIFCSLIVLSLGLMVSAQAQASTEYRVNVPFDFNVGDKIFQAGDYVIALAGQNKNILTIREAKSEKANFIQTVSKTTNEKTGSAKLVFTRYDDRYFLAEMVSPTINTKFIKAKDEERLAKMQESKRQTVAMVK